MTLIVPSVVEQLQGENRRLAKLLALLLADRACVAEPHAFRITNAAMVAPLNAELCVRDEHGVTSAWLEPSRDPDLAYTPPPARR